MTHEEALENLNTYGSNFSRWPSAPSAAIKADPAFAEAYEQIKALDAALDNMEFNDDGVDVGEEDEEDEDGKEPPPEGDSEGAGGRGDPDDEADFEVPDYDEDPEDFQDSLGGVGASQVLEDTTEDLPPIEIDLDSLSDTDDALALILAETLANAFDESLQTDYSRDYDKVVPMPHTPDKDISRYDEYVAKRTGVMQKELQRQLVARAQSFNVGGFRSGRLNGPALHRARAGREDLFRRKVENKTMATAVTLLIDCSGSMGSDKKIETACFAAWAFAHCLDRLRIPCEILGFTTGRIDWTEQQEIQDGLQKMIERTGLPANTIRWVPLYMPVFKAFGETFAVEQKRRLAYAMESGQNFMGSNNDAIALDYASARLLQRQEPRKIMIVFSDGMPADSVKSAVIGNTMRKTIERNSKLGVETIGIGIKTEAVKKFYPKNIVLQNVDALPGLVISQLSKLLLA